MNTQVTDEYTIQRLLLKSAAAILALAFLVTGGCEAHRDYQKAVLLANKVPATDVACVYDGNPQTLCILLTK